MTKKREMSVGDARRDKGTEFVIREYFSDRLSTALELLTEDLDNGKVDENMIQNCTMARYPGCDQEPDQWVISMVELVEEIPDKNSITFFTYGYDFEDEEE